MLENNILTPTQLGITMSMLFLGICHVRNKMNLKFE